MKKLIVEKQLTTLITLHDINLALRYGDRIIILNNNKIVESIDCNEENYEVSFLKVMEDIYERKLDILHTEVGPFIMC